MEQTLQWQIIDKDTHVYSLNKLTVGTISEKSLRCVDIACESFVWPYNEILSFHPINTAHFYLQVCWLFSLYIYIGILRRRYRSRSGNISIFCSSISSVCSMISTRRRSLVYPPGALHRRRGGMRPIVVTKCRDSAIVSLHSNTQSYHL